MARSAVELLEPVGAVGPAFEFRWTPVTDASHYRVQVRDAAGALLFILESNADRAPLPVALGERLLEGQAYTWSVEALDAFGDVMVGSRSVEFTIQLQVQRSKFKVETAHATL